MASILTIANDVADDLSLARVTTLFDVTDEGDQNSRVLLRAITRVCRHLAAFWTWPALTAEKTFTSIANGAQTSSVETTLLRIIPGTMWDRTNDCEVLGPLTPREWQERQALSSAVIKPAFMVRGRGTASIYLSSPHATGATIAYEYVVNSVGTATDGTTRRAERFTADTDLTYWTDELIHLGMAWALKHRDGMLNNVEYDAFKMAANDEMNQAAIGDVLSMAHSPLNELPLAEGNWSIT